jgi:hypothetical protein
MKKIFFSLIAILISFCSKGQLKYNTDTCKHNSSIWNDNNDYDFRIRNDTAKLEMTVLDKHVILKDKISKKVIYNIYNPYFINYYAELSKNGRWLAITGYEDVQFLIYDLLQKKIVAKQNENEPWFERGYPPSPRHLNIGGIFSPNEKFYIADLSNDEQVLFNLANGKKIFFKRVRKTNNKFHFEKDEQLRFHRYNFSPNERLLIDDALGYYNEESILIYSLPNGMEVDRIKLPFDSLIQIQTKYIDSSCESCLKDYIRDSVENNHPFTGIDNLQFINNGSFKFQIRFSIKRYYNSSSFSNSDHYYYNGFYNIKTKELSFNFDKKI